MKPSIKNLGLIAAVAGMAATLNCGTLTPADFPKTVEWLQRTVNNAVNIRPAAVEVADFDGDGLLDIVAGYPGTDTVTAAVYIFFQVDVDNFTAIELATSADLTGLAALAVADLDRDTHSDVVAACDGEIVYLHSPVDSRQAADWTLSIIDQSSGENINQWNDVAIGDIDSGNGSDIVACNANTGRLCWFQSPADASSGTGWLRIDIDTTTRSNASAVALGQIDGDGRLDIYSTAPGETAARVAWYANPADPVSTAWKKRTIGNFTSAARIALGDLNADGYTDIVVTNPPGRQIGWYVQPADPTTNTSGTWAGYLITRYTTNQPSDVKVADIDGNNQLDIVVATQQSGSLRWFTPIGVQTLQWGENNLRDLDEDIGRIAVGDIDADGRPDVVAPLLAATTAQDSVSWLDNPEP